MPQRSGTARRWAPRRRWPALTEALGMAPSGSAAIPAVDSPAAARRGAAGAQIIDLVAAGTRPSDIMTRDAFENAIRTLHAIGGSTNAVIHLVAIAGRLGVDLPLDLFDELAGVHPAPGQHQALRGLPDGGLLLRRRPAGGPRTDRRPPPPRRADRDRADRGRGHPGAAIINDDVDPDPRQRPARAGAASPSCAATCARTARSSRSPRPARDCSSTRGGPSSSGAWTSSMGRSTILRSTSGPTTSSCSRTAGRWVRPACPRRATFRCPRASCGRVSPTWSGSATHG